MWASATYRRLAEPSQVNRRPSNSISSPMRAPISAAASTGSCTNALTVRLPYCCFIRRRPTRPSFRLRPQTRSRTSTRSHGGQCPSSDRRVLVPLVEQPVGRVAHHLGIESSSHTDATSRRRSSGGRSAGTQAPVRWERARRRRVQEVLSVPRAPARMRLQGKEPEAHRRGWQFRLTRGRLRRRGVSVIFKGEVQEAHSAS